MGLGGRLVEFFSFVIVLLLVHFVVAPCPCQVSVGHQNENVG